MRGAVRRAGRRLMSLPFIEYLTPARLDAASGRLGLAWTRHRVRYPLWYELAVGGATSRTRAPSRFDLWEASSVILFVNPRATRPSNRRFPLSIMAVGAALPVDETWEIVDGNLPDADLTRRAVGAHRAGRRSGDPVRAVAFTVMPGPQLVSAVPLSRELKARFPRCRSCGAATSRASIRRRA